jgi:hypothetical protein
VSETPSQNKIQKGWGCGSSAKVLVPMDKALGSIPRTATTMKEIYFKIAHSLSKCFKIL